LGTLRDIADLNESTGVTSVTNHRTYNAFGKLTAETNTAVDVLFGYTCKQLDEATGLQHNLHRWFDSVLGKWINEDPLGFEGGDENLVRYAHGSIVNLTDPLGLEEFNPNQNPPSNSTSLIPVPPRLFPEVHLSGYLGGTPVKPIGTGLAIALGGEKDNPLYADYVTDPTVAAMPDGTIRGITTDLRSQSVSDISIRSVGMNTQIWEEILRIAKPGCVVTFSGPATYWKSYYKDIKNLKVISGYQQLSTTSNAILPSRHPDGKWNPSPVASLIFTVRLRGNETVTK
jgi:RHS repeat-associated protein